MRYRYPVHRLTICAMQRVFIFPFIFKENIMDEEETPQEMYERIKRERKTCGRRKRHPYDCIYFFGNHRPSGHCHHGL